MSASCGRRSGEIKATDDLSISPAAFTNCKKSGPDGRIFLFWFFFNCVSDQNTLSLRQLHSKPCRERKLKMLYRNNYRSPLGEILLAADEEGLTGLWFMENQKHMGEGLSENAVRRSLPVFDETARWLDLYFSGKDPGFTPQLHLTGSAFRRRVGEIMLEIPYGETTTYGEIARRIAAERGISRMSSRAVGGAVGRNPISLIIPCHRVIGSDGSLTGYGGGLERKAALLRLEQHEHES
jgi:methylated-DNA-[protein]-cysteine S-methyltransferase